MTKKELYDMRDRLLAAATKDIKTVEIVKEETKTKEDEAQTKETVGVNVISQVLEGTTPICPKRQHRRPKSFRTQTDLSHVGF